MERVKIMLELPTMVFRKNYQALMKKQINSIKIGGTNLITKKLI